MDSALNGELAFFQLAATLIPLLLFSGVVAERADSLHGLPRHVGLKTGVIAALILGALGITAEVFSIRALIRGSAKPFWIDFVATTLVLSLALVVGFAIWAWFGKAARAKKEPKAGSENTQTSQPVSKLTFETTILATVSALFLIVVTVLGTAYILRSVHSWHRIEVTEKEDEKVGDDARLEVQLLEGDLERTTMRQMRMLAAIGSDENALLTLAEKVRHLKRADRDTQIVVLIAHRKWVAAAKLNSAREAEQRLTAKAHTLVAKLAAERSILGGLSTKHEELIDHEGA
jgi:hypothetical protein